MSESELEAAVGAWAARCGLQTRGLALDWLPPAALAWAACRLGPANRLPPGYSEIKSHELLNDKDLELEFLNIYKRNAIHITTDPDILEEDKQKLEDLQTQIEYMKSERDLLEKNSLLGSELDYEFNKELEHFKRIKTEKIQELADATEVCENLATKLNAEKNNLHNTFVTETDNLIQDGSIYENQINDNQFKEYFSGNEYIYSYFKYYLKQRRDESYTKVDNEDSNLYNIDTVVHTSKKIEDAIWNYIKTKAELNESKECLEFQLRYSNRCDTIEKYLDLKLLKPLKNEKDSFHIIRTFVKNQIGNALYEELKLRVMKVEILHEELDMILNKICTIISCNEIILSSLNKREENKDKIINLFYSMAKFLMTDINAIQHRRDIIQSKSAINDKSNSINEIELLKDSICEIFKLSRDVDLNCALKIVDSNADDLSKLINSQLTHQFEEFHMQCDKNKRACENVKKFIWDGCASQPNICNRGMEITIYNMEKQNLADKDKINNATNNFMQLKTDLKSCSTILK